LQSRNNLHKEIKFEEPQFTKKCNDTVFSKGKNEIFITRNWLTSECTHSLTLSGESINRWSEEE